jgi:flagellar biosynthesis protein FlhG
VGKSNVVVNLGLALVRQGLQVLLIDADLGLGNLDILLGLEPRYTIHDAISLRHPLSEVMVAGPEGLKILPASAGIPELAHLDDQQKLFLLSELDEYAENLDVVLIDTGAGISRNVLFFNIAAAETILVANNQPTSLMDAYALVKILATRYRRKHFKLLANGVAGAGEAESIHQTLSRVVTRFLGPEIVLEFLGSIPYDLCVPKAVMNQKPVTALFPQAPSSRSFTAMAQHLLDSPPAAADGNIKLFGRRLMQVPF